MTTQQSIASVLEYWFGAKEEAFSFRGGLWLHGIHPSQVLASKRSDTSATLSSLTGDEIRTRFADVLESVTMDPVTFDAWTSTREGCVAQVIVLGWLLRLCRGTPQMFDSKHEALIVRAAEKVFGEKENPLEWNYHVVLLITLAKIERLPLVQKN